MEPELVERARRGDLDAYGRLIECTRGMVHDVVSRVIRDPHLAEDTMQEVYLRAFRRLADLRDPGAFSGWLGHATLGRRPRLGHDPDEVREETA